MPFWTTAISSTTDISDPKRKFRFIVIIGGIKSGAEGANAAWYAKSVTKPGFTIATTEHKYLNHTFYYPGSVTWNEVELKLVDPVDPDMTATLSDIVESSGYVIPSNVDEKHTMDKQGAVGALGEILIKQIDADGNDQEIWTLNNAFITDINFGDLEYGSDDINELSVKLRYDWANCTTPTSGGSAGSSAESGKGGNGPFFSSTTA
tara:strand:+ start:16401 stop:17018 length:618 start_codon:yes stop_codon:yes gene_type:complete